MVNKHNDIDQIKEKNHTKLIQQTNKQTDRINFTLNIKYTPTTNFSFNLYFRQIVDHNILVNFHLKLKSENQ